jgi:hypothetical protein
VTNLGIIATNITNKPIHGWLKNHPTNMIKFSIIVKMTKIVEIWFCNCKYS